MRFQLDVETPRLTVQCADGEFDLPALWLRERCQDARQVDKHTHQRLYNPHRLPDDLQLTGAQSAGDGVVRLSFSDGYCGTYDLEELADEIRAQDPVPAPRPWDSTLDLENVSFDWSGLADERRFHESLDAFLRFGFLILDGVPTEREYILEVARKFGHLRETNFGRYFEVYSRPASNDLAYSSHGLDPHTDNPYREPVPGIQLLHCLANEVEGGRSTLADALAAARALAHEDPGSFRLLAETPVRFRFLDAEEEFIERRPLIRRNALGEVTGVHYSPRLDGLPLLPEEELRSLHRARRRLGELLGDRRFEIRLSLSPGRLLMFDNARIVHGRTAYDAGAGRRHLQGCYIDVDEPRSRYRTLTRSLAPIGSEAS